MSEETNDQPTSTRIDGPSRARGKRSPEVEAAIIANIEATMPKGSAAEAVGVDRTTLWTWEKADPAFAARLVEAEATAKRRLLVLLLQKALSNVPSSVNAATWLLERRWPDEFGLKARIDISVDLRGEAERLAAEHGLNVDEVLKEADAIVAASTKR